MALRAGSLILTLLGLNLMYGVRVSKGKATASQVDVQKRMVSKTLRMLGRLAAVDPVVDGDAALESILGAHSPECARDQSRLIASRCDLLTGSGGVDPLRHLPDDFRTLVTSPMRLFPLLDRKFDKYAHT